jgi:cytochrome c biogenesis protein CcdA
MDNNKLMSQVTTIFGIFMVLFYLGVGIYLIFYFDRTYLDRAVLVIIGSSFILYGVYRAFRTYSKIVELFFRDDSNDKEDKYL